MLEQLANINQIIKIVFLFLVIINVKANHNKNKQSNDVKYQIKWVYDDYSFPIYLVKKLDQSVDADYKWFRLTDQVYIDEIEEYTKYYIDSTTSESTILYILNYNFSTHDQLASYEPKIIAVRSDSSDENNDESFKLEQLNKKREVFTLAYLKSHSIVIDDKNDPNKIDYSCSVTVLLPLNEHQSDLRSEYNALLQHFIYIKMTVLSSDDDADFLNLNHKHENKHKINNFRLHKRDVDNKVVNFLEVEIREGPISVFKSFGKTPRKDNISCFLKLTDSDDTTYPKYQNTIIKLNDKTTVQKTTQSVQQRTTKFKAAYPTRKIPLSNANSLTHSYLNFLTFLTFCFIYFILI